MRVERQPLCSYRLLATHRISLSRYCACHTMIAGTPCQANPDYARTPSNSRATADNIVDPFVHQLRRTPVVLKYASTVYLFNCAFNSSNVADIIDALQNPRVLGFVFPTKVVLQGKELELPPSLGRLTTLLWLEVFAANLRRVEPAAIGGLRQLRLLNLRNNLLATIPSEIGHLTGLLEVFLQGNSKLSSVPTAFWGLTSLRRLRLNGNAISVLPSLLGRLTNLEELWLNQMKLVDLPSSIGRLTALGSADVFPHGKQLRFDGNALTRLPSQLGLLTQLRTLRFDDNKLTHVPPELGRLLRLKTLEMSGNRLTSVPDFVAGMASLQSCSVKNNMIAAVVGWGVVKAADEGEGGTVAGACCNASRVVKLKGNPVCVNGMMRPPSCGWCANVSCG